MIDNVNTWENEGGAINPERRAEKEDDEDILVVSSEPGGKAHRLFTLVSPEPPDAPQLPAELKTEAELVKAMEGFGYRLGMIGGGSRIDEIRRFYFRKLSGESSP
jgi:hypothetical protein